MYIYIIDYNYNKIKDFESNIDALFEYAYKNKNKYIILWNIDPYWKTIFNEIQINNIILEELNDIIKEFNNIAWIEEFKSFLKNINNHNFLVIVWE